MNQVNQGGKARPVGDLSHRVVRDLGLLQPAPTGWKIRNFLRYRRREVPQGVAYALLGNLSGIAVVRPTLTGMVYRRPEGLPIDINRRVSELLRENVSVRELARHFGGSVTDYGVMSRRLVTDTGVAFLVDALQNLTEPENFKFHAFGTGTTAEAASQTALVTELTTQYNPDNTRPTGSQTESAANVYRTVGTLSPDTGGTIAVTEHGLMSQAGTGGGTMFDRSVFTAVNLVAGADSLQTTYDLTIASGG